MSALFADDPMSLIQIVERLGALGLIALLMVWFIRFGFPQFRDQLRDSLKELGQSHLAAITKIVDDHRVEQDSCDAERIENAKVVMKVAERAETERDKDREARLQFITTLNGINDTLKNLKKDN